MTTTAPPLIDVHNLHITTGEKILVNNINLHIAPGERVGLIGESGSGKSLTAAAIAGLLPENLTTTGTINLHGNNLLNTRHHTRTAAANIGFIFQEPMTALDPTMRVGNQIIEALQARAALNRTHARTAAIELLEEMRLPNPTHTMTAYPHQLSGGQRQRVVAAIAMAGNPDLLICDEPTTALDVTVQASVLERIVAGATQRGSAVLFISHDIAVVGTVCERTIVMQSGHIVEDRPSTDLYHAPQHPYTQRLIASAPTITGALAGKQAADLATEPT
ncbi:ABC transporter ATP-binding protein [Dermatophilus congolensis]|uniref:ABC transporter ATP-binding protein n=1 Tax=Dermatophilus congolensis TaxID=1863 RepID=UPI001AAEBE58|nr:ABC transporter ATP-binding protein [Dermatophilus congolensis]MBO3132125.1 ABC transporter ATP-binding protein [Dermatophilus congolensis]